MSGDADDSGILNPTVREAYDRFRRCAQWEGNARERFLDDLKFANGDAYNGYQWPNDIRRNRDVDERPVLTINKVRQHNLQIVNDMKRNMPSVRIRAVGGGASYEAAQVYEGLVRHIQYESTAKVAYATAAEFQVTAGVGYWRVLTEYTSDDEFNQGISIKRIIDPLGVYMDPDAKEKDCSDARFCFIFSDVPKDQFDKDYPDFKNNPPGGSALETTVDTWISKDYVRVAEYYRKSMVKDELLAMVDEKGQRMLIKKSQLPPEVYKAAKADPRIQRRPAVTPKVEWFKIVGDRIADKREVVGKYIPVVKLAGEEIVIDGILDRKGHTRAMLDSQRMYNYWSSSAVEQVALQTKTPFIAPAAAVEGFETMWNSANRVNSSVLIYNGRDDEGNVIQPPARAEPPVMADAYIKGIQLASTDMMAASGQWQNAMGQQGNERTGKAIDLRQDQGDNATFHFWDNLDLAIAYTGKIILDMIPSIYDTKRIVQILAEDGTEMNVTLDPSAQQPYSQEKNADNEIVNRVLNPQVGQYMVVSDAGPNYMTKREDAREHLTLLATQSPAIAGVIPDLILQSCDFPLAAEAARRLRRMVPKEALGEGPTQKEQLLTQQVEQLTTLLTQSMDKLGQEKNKSRSKDQLRALDVYGKETDRLKVFIDAMQANQAEMRAMMEQLTQEVLSNNSLDVVEETSAVGLKDDLAAGGDDIATGELEMGGQGSAIGRALAVQPDASAPPVPGARQAPDGNWYTPDPSRPGKYMMVAAGASGNA